MSNNKSKKNDRVVVAISCLRRKPEKKYWLSIDIDRSSIGLIKLYKPVAKWLFNRITKHFDEMAELEKSYTCTVKPYSCEHLLEGWTNNYYVKEKECHKTFPK